MDPGEVPAQEAKCPAVGARRRRKNWDAGRTGQRHFHAEQLRCLRGGRLGRHHQPPEVAILGVGRIMDTPWVVNGELAVRKVTELTLAFDHRVCDGGTAAGFLRFVADGLESPGSVLADL